MKKYCRAEIKNGKFISNKEKFKQTVGSLPDGSYLLLLIKQSDRTLREDQNYYFVQLGEWSLSTGYTKEELHEIIKTELFVELFDEPLSTSDLNKEQWSFVFFNLENFLLMKFENK